MHESIERESMQLTIMVIN